MPSLCQGRIVFPVDPVPDPQGQNPKPDRPFVVVSTPKEIASGDDLKLVGITTELTLSTPEDYIHLPTGPRSKSRLADGSAALRTWQVLIPQTDVRITDRFLWPKQVWEILQSIDEIGEHWLPPGRDRAS